MKINLLALFGAIIFFSRGVIAPLSFKHTYCCMRCGIRHIMCQYPRPGPGSLCEDFIRSGLTYAEKKLVLDIHNEIRNHVASGKLKQFPAKGADIRELEWDDELELFAKRYADQCILKWEPICHDSIRFRVGQNYALGQESGSQTLPTIEDHVRQWYAGYKDCNTTEQFCNVYDYAYDFTQMVWGNSYKLGCSYSEFKTTNVPLKEKTLRNILVCNYAPSGNIARESPYKVGEPCSACSNGSICSDKYTSLCTANAVRIYPKRKYLFTMASISLVLIILKNFI